MTPAAATADQLKLPQFKLLLPPADPSFSVEIRSSPAVAFEKRQLTIERAGRAFHALQRRISGLSWIAEAKKKKQEAAKTPITRTATPVSDGAEDDEDDTDLLLFGKKEERNYYALLGISQLGLNASEKQIKRAYQEMILKVHPDKIRPGASQEEITSANALFRDVQKAYEVLSDVEKRRGYDSQFEFDDWIPNGLETLKDDAAFFELYGPVLQSNARFSVVKPVPLLGEPDDDETSVKTMYNFWRTFRSWRDFSAFDEFKDGDIETAEGRDHRRYMMKRNEAQREKRKRKEFQRIQSLVERAYKNDPRIARFKAEVEKAKEDAIRARETARKAQEETRLAEEARIERERVEKERLNAERRDAEKKAKLAAKNNRKKSLKQLQSALEPFQLNELQLARDIDLFSNGDADDIQALADKVTSAKSAQPFLDKCSEIRKNLQTIAEEEEAARRKKAEEQAAVLAKEKAEEKARKTLVWPPEALSFLAKGMAKHPGGTRNRWQCIATFVGTCGFQATPDDCIEASKKLAAAGPAKPATLVTGGSLPEPSPTVAPPAASLPVAAASAASEQSGSKEVREWTPEEQKLLEAALREFPSTMEINERWTAIAGKVGTRSKKECAARVKELRAKAKQ